MMRLIFVCCASVLLLLVAGCGRAVDPAAAASIQKALETFDKARSPDDFLRAAALYQDVLDRGFVSGAVYYNQGNALMRAGQRGRAIAAYRQAQRYLPRDPYLEANLAYALAGESPTAKRRPVIEYVLFWQDWLGYPAKFQLLAGAIGVACALGFLAVLFEKRILVQLGLAAAAVSLVLGVSAGYDAYRYQVVAHGVIVDREVVARKGNATSYEPALTEPLKEGTEFQVMERRPDWLLIRLAGQQEGWVPQKAVVVY
jgi:tetratricopeptide (TPR) repeat protein